MRLPDAPYLLAFAVAVMAQSADANGSCRAIDGDTLRCGRERIRLVGIDAPEMPDHCRRGRRCVSGDPLMSQASLQRALIAPIVIERVGRDHYGRTLAFVSGGGVDLACVQLRRRQAIYKRGWDIGGRIGKCAQ